MNCTIVCMRIWIVVLLLLAELVLVSLLFQALTWAPVVLASVSRDAKPRSKRQADASSPRSQDGRAAKANE